jgi:nickel/cobalt transporter (NicO) family protein
MLAQAELGPLETYFVRLIDAEQLGPVFVAGALALALGIGAVHALAPGHGKAIIAAYLVGSRGRPRDAVALGVIVSAMHTFSVLVLGLGLYALTSAPGTGDRVGPWMLLASGLLVLVVGIGLVTRQVLRRRQRVPAHHGQEGRDGQDGDGGHAGHHHHHELPPDVPPLSRKGLVLLGISGGLLPSPSAFLVLATALFMGRLAFGLLLVAMFSIGLAATLTIIGLAVLHGRNVVSRKAIGNPRLARVTAALPLISSVLILAGGIYLTTVAAFRL